MRVQDYLDGKRVLIAREDYEKLQGIETALNKRLKQIQVVAVELSKASANVTKAITEGWGTTAYHYECGRRDGLRDALKLLGTEPEREDDGMPF